MPEFILPELAVDAFAAPSIFDFLPETIGSEFAASGPIDALASSVAGSELAGNSIIDAAGSSLSGAAAGATSAADFAVAPSLAAESFVPGTVAPELAGSLPGAVSDFAVAPSLEAGTFSPLAGAGPSVAGASGAIEAGAIPGAAAADSLDLTGSAIGGAANATDAAAGAAADPFSGAGAISQVGGTPDLFSTTPIAQQTGDVLGNFQAPFSSTVGSPVNEFSPFPSVPGEVSAFPGFPGANVEQFGQFGQVPLGSNTLASSLPTTGDVFAPTTTTPTTTITPETSGATVQDFNAASSGIHTPAVSGAGSDLVPGVPPPSGAATAATDTASTGTASLPAAVSPSAPADFSAAPGITPNTFAPGTQLAGSSGGIASLFGNNPLLLASLGVGAAGVGASALRSLSGLPDQAQLQQIAAQAASNSAAQQAEAQQLIAPLISGVLPPSQAQQVQQALQDAITQKKAKYASMNLSGSSAEVADIAATINQSISLAGQLEQIMANAGINLSSQATQSLNVESTIFQSLMNANINADNALTQAIASFAGQAGIASAINARGGTKTS